MKKSTIVIILGAFIVITALLGINTNTMYQKKKSFNSATEVIAQLKNNQLTAFDKNGDLKETDELKECFSERKRLTYSGFNSDKVEIEKEETLTEEQKRSILKEYDTFRNNFSKRRVITKEEPIRLNIIDYSLYLENGTIKYSNPKKIKLDLVLIDEGEGLVIDYIMRNNTNEMNEEGNQDA